VEREKRRILCGDATHFQGDERDVIFLSMVANNEGDGLLSLRGDGAGQSIKQRYYVAASRARNQLWVVHSLEYGRDLKSGDLRKELLEFAQNPQTYLKTANIVEAKAESQFEEAVGKALIGEGYNIVPQWEAGSYRIDLVAIYKELRIAIECDG